MSDDFTIDFSGKKKHRCALVIDFDHTLYDGVSFLAKIAKDISDERGVSYNIPFFAKKFLRARFSSALSNIVKNDSTEKTEDLVEDIFAQFDKALKSAEPNPVVLEICKTTLENEGQAVFISSRPQELLEEKIEAFGLEGAEIYRLERQERFAEFPRDSWARAARQLK
ncbi:MAG: hypothetical protein GX804_08345, partial [Lentisphaerae bacterium]|nr:hypothetical protein [Lentisphaerota bacterium]